MSGSASFCAIVGCSASKTINRGLSFFGLPKKGISVEKDEWRSRLLDKINRCDARFNPERAAICSRHFTESSYTMINSSGKRKLFVGSLPTEFMPSRCMERPKTTKVLGKGRNRKVLNSTTEDDVHAREDSAPADTADMHVGSLAQMLKGSNMKEYVAFNEGLPCTSDEDVMPFCAAMAPSASQEATTSTRTTLAECVTEDEEGGEEKREEKTDDDAVIDFQTALLYCAKVTEFATKNIPALAETLRSVQADIQAVFSQREENARDEVNDAPSIKVGSQQWGETCCARGCDAGRCHGVGSLFPFPAKKARCTQWLRSVGREDLLEKSAKQLHREGYKVCSSHFKPHFLLSAGRRVRLAHNAVPTLNKSERRRPQKKKSVAEKSGPKQKRNRSQGQTKAGPEAAVLPEVKVEVDWAMDPALHWNKIDHHSLCSDGTDPAEEVEDPSSLFGPVPMNTCEMGASSSSSSTQAGSVGYVKSEPVEEGMEERFLSGSGGGDPQMESACCTRTTGHVMTDSVVGEVKSWNCAHVNCEHMNCDHGNCEHMNCDHGNCEHMNCGHGNSEHMNCGHGNSEHRSSSDAVTGGEPLDSREQVSGGDRQTSTTDVIDDWDMSYIVVKAEPQSDSDTEVDKT